MAKVLNDDFEVSKFKFQPHYYIYLQTNTFGKYMKTIILTDTG